VVGYIIFTEQLKDGALQDVGIFGGILKKGRKMVPTHVVATIDFENVKVF
jgi:hypothetical protein